MRTPLLHVLQWRMQVASHSTFAVSCARLAAPAASEPPEAARGGCAAATRCEPAAAALPHRLVPGRRHPSVFAAQRCVWNAPSRAVTGAWRELARSQSCAVCILASLAVPSAPLRAARCRPSQQPSAGGLCKTIEECAPARPSGRVRQGRQLLSASCLTATAPRSASTRYTASGWSTYLLTHICSTRNASACRQPAVVHSVCKARDWPRTRDALRADLWHLPVHASTAVPHAGWYLLLGCVASFEPPRQVVATGGDIAHVEVPS